MGNGYTAQLLRVNLNEKSTRTENIDSSFLKNWVGGTGFGVKIISEEVEPSVSWESENNKIIIATGPLSGTKVNGSGTFSVVTKGAMTGGVASTQANGFMGAYLKSCGYDLIVLEGSSNDWVYLFIGDDSIDIKSANHLVGCDTIDTQDKIHQELNLNSKQLSVYCIGPAGENSVRFAGLFGDYGHAAAHNGIGAVLGSKKIKAIAVKRGKNIVNFSNKTELSRIAKEMDSVSKSSYFGGQISQFGTNAGYPLFHSIGGLPVKNYTTNIFPPFKDFDGANIRTKFEYKKKPCWGCNWSHCGILKIKDGEFQGFEAEEPEYEVMAAMGSLVGIEDPAESIVLGDLIDRLGMDANETGWVVAWVLECFEKGYFTKEELDGLEMTWGNYNSINNLINKIAVREGIGEFLAKGVKNAAEKKGSPAIDCAVYTYKGNTPRGHDHRAIWTELLDTCVSNTGTIESTGGGINTKQHGLEPISDQFSWEQVAKQNAILNGRRIFEDCLGICRFPAEDINLTVQAVNASTGWKLSLEDAMNIGKRIVHLMHIYNLRSGLTVELDKPSPRYCSTPVDGPVKGHTIAKDFEKMKECYYEQMGWDKDSGEVLPDTLKKYDLANLKII